MTRLALTLCGFLLASSSLVAGYQFSSLRDLPDPASAQTKESPLASSDAPVTVDFIVTQCVPEQDPATTTFAGIDSLLPIELVGALPGPGGNIGIQNNQPPARRSVAPEAAGEPTLWASPLNGQATSVVEVSHSVWLLE